MHAWDCPCGTRNAPAFACCRSCSAPRAVGRIVPSLGRIVPADYSTGNNPSRAQRLANGLVALLYYAGIALFCGLAGLIAVLFFPGLLSRGFAILAITALVVWQLRAMGVLTPRDPT